MIAGMRDHPAPGGPRALRGEDKVGQVVEAIALAAHDRGWRVLVVGGAVRDMVLGRRPKDVDLEVYGRFAVDDLVAFLGRFGPVDAVGKSFGVLKLTVDGVELDVALPRRENKAGRGHKGFLVEPDPTMTPREAAMRRDFTFNGMAYDPLTGEVLDFFGGREDLARRRLRHIGPAFAEDPLRVLRGFQFAGRFGLTAEPETVALCRSLLPEYPTLARERVWGEWQKWATKSLRPSRGLVFLYRTGWLRLYPELAALVGCPQDPEWHPEGSVWQHTKWAVDAMARICERDGVGGEDRVVLMLAALLHDVGKPATTRRRGGRIVSPGHAQAGVEPARAFLARIAAPRRVVERVLPLVREHMAHVSGEPTPRAARRLALRLHPATVEEWARVVEADHSARPPRPGGLPPRASRLLGLARKLGVARRKPAPILMGRHLIAQGMTPGPHFGRILRAAYEAQIEGAFTDLEGALRWLGRAKE